MADAGEWILITYRLPADSSRARVAVWREVRRSGALHVQPSVVAFPATDAFREAVDGFRAEVERVGGQTLSVAAQPLEGGDAQRLTGAWNQARDEEYGELEGKCHAFLREIEHEFAIEKFTLAELEEEEAEFDKLERWCRRIAQRDLHHASRSGAVEAVLAEAGKALERYTQAVYERTRPS